MIRAVSSVLTIDNVIERIIAVLTRYQRVQFVGGSFCSSEVMAASPSTLDT